MTKTFATLMAIAMLSVAPASAATQVANSAISPLCGADAPESYKRAGGYCEQLDDMKSLGASDSNCGSVAELSLRANDIQGEVKLAGAISPCCKLYGSVTNQMLAQQQVILVAEPACAP